jgi:hypothetical protein
MNAYKLFKQDGTPTNVWMCEACDRGWVAVDGRGIAERCCRCDVCGEPLDKKTDYSHRHRECQTLRDKQLYDTRIETAVKLDSWDGPVFNDHDGNGDERDYYASLGDMVEAIEDEDGIMPEYVFVCDAVPAVQLCIIDILERFVDLDEDRNCDLTGEPELEAALDAFNESNKSIVTWNPDYTRVVRAKR